MMTLRTRDKLAAELRKVAERASPENAATYEAFAVRAATGEFDDYADTYVCPITQLHSELCAAGFTQFAKRVAGGEFDATKEERVLICALTGEVPPVVRRQPWRRRIDLDYDTMLSRVAAATCREEGLLHWFCSFMGDELHLTDAGKEAARIAQVRHTLRAGVNI